MTSPRNLKPDDPKTISRPIRVAVIGAVLAVAACFGVALSLAGAPAAAEQSRQVR